MLRESAHRGRLSPHFECESERLSPSTGRVFPLHECVVSRVDRAGMARHIPSGPVDAVIFEHEQAGLEIFEDEGAGLGAASWLLPRQFVWREIDRREIEGQKKMGKKWRKGERGQLQK